VRAVIQDLLADFDLSNAQEVLFSGCSAGGQGVVVNSDFVASLLPNGTKYGSFADAGWMMNIIPVNPNTVTIQFQVQSGWKYWNGQVDTSCAQSNPGNEWMCYISPYAVPHITSPILIQTEQYDAFQLPYDCCTPPFNASQQQFANMLRTAFSVSLQEVREPATVYSAACFAHCFSEDAEFWTVEATGISLREVLGNWYFSRGGTVNVIDDCEGFNCSKNCPK